MINALPPAFSTSRAAPRKPSIPRASKATRAPVRAKATAVARPTPADAPVITTTLVLLSCIACSCVTAKDSGIFKLETARLFRRKTPAHVQVAPGSAIICRCALAVNVRITGFRAAHDRESIQHVSGWARRHIERHAARARHGRIMEVERLRTDGRLAYNRYSHNGWRLPAVHPRPGPATCAESTSRTSRTCRRQWPSPPVPGHAASAGRPGYPTKPVPRASPHPNVVLVG